MRKKALRILGVALVMALVMGLFPVMSASAAAAIGTPNPSSAAPGTSVSISGTGFNTSSTSGVIHIGSYQVGSVVMNGGNFTGAFQLPNYIPRGTYSLTVTSNLNDTSNAQPFTIIPGLVLSATSGGVGDQITVTGYGFTASNTVSIQFDAVTQLTTTANSQGSFSVTLTIPNTVRGTHSISAYDLYGASGTLVFTVIAKLTATPTSATVGTPLTITGSAFAASSTITIYFDGTSVTSTVSNTNGSFTISNFAMPAATSGAHTIKAQDASGNYQTISVSVISSIAVDPISGPANTQVTITGNGFRASETITLTIDNTALSNSGVTTDTLGRFTAMVTIPAMPSGDHQIKAADSINSDTETFTVTADISVSPNRGYVGTEITVNGTGFLANQGITIIFDNSPLGTATSNSQGSFSGRFTIPSRQAGSYKIRVTDGLNTKEINFSVTTSATITATSATSPGYVGQPVTVSGVGFNVGSTVVVSYDGKQVATGTVGSDSNFSITFAAPASKAGGHTITVTDGTVNIPLDYYMDATAPSAPTLIAPVTGERQKAQGTFSWNEVNDPSGVTYTLQIANSSSFGSGSILLEKTGLTSTEYTLTKEEALKSTKKDLPDYWRVRAIDNASNQGNWSNVWAFTVGGTLPTWALWTLIGLGALIVILFAFWVGRRSSMSKPPSTRIED